VIPRQVLDDHAIRVLLVVPDEADRAVLARLVGNFRHGSHTIEHVASDSSAREAIAAAAHDVYLVYADLGQTRGVDLIAEARAEGSTAPFVVLSPTNDYDHEVEALTVGATDHLELDGLTAEALERSLRHALVHAQTRAELASARDTAEAATEAKTKFLANISHDIRTPLNTIIGMTEIVLRDTLTPTQREALETVLIAADSLQDLAEGLVNVEKIESGEIELDPGPFNIRDTVADVLRIFGLQAKQKGLHLEVDIPSDVPEMVIADGGRVQQVLIDLVSNAVRYTDRGRIDVSVDTGDDPRFLQVTVTDTGTGMPEDLLPTLFERSAKSATVGGSTGLGVAHRIVTALGGTISATSKVGKGSRFAFTFGAEAVIAGLSGDVGTDRASAETVMLMSSSPDDRRGLEADLDGAGFEPLIVGDIGAAVDSAAKAAESGHPLAAIVLDTAYKPFEVARNLIEHAGGRTPVTLLVPSGREGDEPRCREAGVKGYVKKPPAPGILVDVIRATIAATKAGDTNTLFTGESLVSQRSAMNLLVVDDVETNLVLTVRMLTERGHTVTAVRNGIEAIDAFEQTLFDAVLMDLQMPGLDGFDTTAAIRAEEVLRGIRRTPIIALTGHATTDEKEHCVAAGMDGFLSKPVRPDALFAAVEQFASVGAVA